MEKLIRAYLAKERSWVAEDEVLRITEMGAVIDVRIPNQRERIVVHHSELLVFLFERQEELTKC